MEPFTLSVESLLSNPSPGPLRLVKAPAAGHPLPGERAVFVTSTRPTNDSPLPGERVPDGGGRVRGSSIQRDQPSRSTHEFGIM